MLIEAKFRHAIKEMMLTKPLEEINVTALCEKCQCHRQTFYYHFQDIYDLLSSVYLVEKIPGLAEAGSIKEATMAFINYVKSNLAFVQSSYNSAAKDMVEDYFNGALTSKIVTLLDLTPENELTKPENRTTARRIAKSIVSEVGHLLKDRATTEIRFERKAKRFAEAFLKDGVPATISVVKKERRH